MTTSTAIVGIIVTIIFLVLISYTITQMLQLWVIASDLQWKASHTSKRSEQIFNKFMAVIVTIGSVIIPLSVVSAYCILMIVLRGE